MASIIGFATAMILCVISATLQLMQKNLFFGLFLTACAICDCVMLIKTAIKNAKEEN